MTQSNPLQKLFFLVSFFISISALQGCFHSDDDPVTYGIGGTVSGLSGSIVLQNNGGDDLTLTEDGTFSFGNFSNGADYAVTVLSQPSGQGCLVSNGSGSIAAATVDNITVSCASHVDMTGYYKDGNLSVTGITDNSTVVAMASSTRLMLLSTGNQLLYDGTLSISGISFTTTATIYKDGSNIGTTTISGSIVGADISGEMTSSVNEGQGSFSVTYADTNNQTADFADIETGGPAWDCDIGEVGGALYEFHLNGPDDLVHQLDTASLPFDLCQLNGTVTAIPNTRIFDADVALSACDPDTDQMVNNYTGLTTGGEIRAGSNYQELFFAVANGDYAVYSLCTR